MVVDGSPTPSNFLHTPRKKVLMKTHPWIMLALVSFAIPSGCSRQEMQTVAVFPVDGQLLIAGKPAVGAVVSFLPTGGAAPRTPIEAVVREDGHFAPTQPDGAIGLPEGEYALSLRRAAAANPPAQEEALGSVTVKRGVNFMQPLRLAR